VAFYTTRVRDSSTFGRFWVVGYFVQRVRGPSDPEGSLPRASETWIVAASGTTWTRPGLRYISFLTEPALRDVPRGS